MDDKVSKVQAEMKSLSGRTGKGRDRRFAVAVDLSLEGVNKWRKEMGLPPLDKLPTKF
jgi:hypothetical protein